MTKETVPMYMITPLELDYLIEIFEELRVLADPSEYLEEEAEEAINILRSLNTQEIDMNDTVEFNVEEYAKTLFGMLSEADGYAVGPEVLVHISENPVPEDQQDAVTVELKKLIDAALGTTPEVAEPQGETQDETPDEEATADEPVADPVSV